MFDVFCLFLKNLHILILLFVVHLLNTMVAGDEQLDEAVPLATEEVFAHCFGGDEKNLICFCRFHSSLVLQGEFWYGN